jgi:hypothetical protein
MRAFQCLTSSPNTIHHVYRLKPKSNSAATLGPDCMIKATLHENECIDDLEGRPQNSDLGPLVRDLYHRLTLQPTVLW